MRRTLNVAPGIGLSVPFSTTVTSMVRAGERTTSRGCGGFPWRATSARPARAGFSAVARRFTACFGRASKRAVPSAPVTPSKGHENPHPTTTRAPGTGAPPSTTRAARGQEAPTTTTPASTSAAPFAARVACWTPTRPSGARARMTAGSQAAAGRGIPSNRNRPPSSATAESTWSPERWSVTRAPPIGKRRSSTTRPFTASEFAGDRDVEGVTAVSGTCGSAFGFSLGGAASGTGQGGWSRGNGGRHGRRSGGRRCHGRPRRSPQEPDRRGGRGKGDDGENPLPHGALPYLRDDSLGAGSSLARRATPIPAFAK